MTAGLASRAPALSARAGVSTSSSAAAPSSTGSTRPGTWTCWPASCFWGL